MAENNIMTAQDANAVSAANLAYLGDCVYELLVREYLVRRGVLRPSVESLAYVTAHVQSGVIEKLLPHLTADEEEAYKRGRNIGHSSIPKSSTVAEYRRATGLESLFGWLHLTGQQERIRELFTMAFEEEKTAETGE